MQEPFDIQFDQGSSALALETNFLHDLETVLNGLGFNVPRPVIVVIGGASELRQYHVARLRSLFVGVLAPLAQALNAVVVDGGTDTGVMRMMGIARQKTHSTFPLIGVLPVGVATLPNAPAPSEEAAPLEPHHTHFILVPGNQWGDESPWIAEVASLIANGAPTVTVLINGGEVTWKDASESVQAGRPIVVVAGSGRAADTLVSALNGKITDKRAKKLLASGLLKAVSIEQNQDLADAVQTILCTDETQAPECVRGGVA
jgi:hypothetical protein